MITNADREDGVEDRQTNGERQCADAGPCPRSHRERATPTTCIETINGDPSTALRLSFQIKVF